MASLANVFTWKPLAVGQSATPLSLTADDGTWIKLPDFKGFLNVVLVFFRSTSDAETEAWLRSLSDARAAFESLDAAIFGVNTARTDQLRAYRGRVGVEFPLLYDPLAFAARGFRASGRIRPFCKDQVVVVGKDGKVLFAERGRVAVSALLACVAAAEGKPAPVVEPPAPARPTAAETVRTPGKPAAAVLDVDTEGALRLLQEPDSPYLLVDVRTKAEYEADRAPNTRHIPVDELPHRHQELGQQNHLIFICQGGGRSAAAAEFMTSLGASHIYNVGGGMSQWTGPRERGPRG